MSLLSQLNSPFMYAVCGSIILFIALVSLFFLIRAYRVGKAMGLDPAKMKRAITASATFTLLPSIGILLGVLAGALAAPLIIRVLEQPDLQFVRTIHILAWVAAVAIEGLFSVVIYSLVFRKVKDLNFRDVA